MSRRRKWRCLKHGRTFKAKAGLASHLRGRQHKKRKKRKVKKAPARVPRMVRKVFRAMAPVKAPVHRYVPPPRPACAFCDQDHGDDGHPFERWDTGVHVVPRKRMFVMPPSLRYRDKESVLDPSVLPVREVRLPQF